MYVSSVLKCSILVIILFYYY